MPFILVAAFEKIKIWFKKIFYGIDETKKEDEKKKETAAGDERDKLKNDDASTKEHEKVS